MDIIDLHTHTTASDGSFTPAQVVQSAKQAGLKALAITDHDTIDGLAEALAAGRETGLEVVPGVEISVESGLGGGMHMLGLFLRPENPGLIEGLDEMKRSRQERNPKIVANFNKLGIDLTLEEVRGYSGGDIISRAHFAQALVARGVVQNRQEAFSRYLRPGKPAYADKKRMQPLEAMSMIRAAGGVPVLAHPGLLQISKNRIEPLVAELKEKGLEGIEAHYSEHSEALTRHLVSLAARHGLIVTGGSDFHGAPKPEISLGVGRGGLRVPVGLLTGLKQRRDKLRQEMGP